MLKLIHMTDLHLTGNGELHFGHDTHETTRLALEHARTHFADASFLVITGDLANWGELTAYRKLEQLLRGFPLPIYLMIGNHDNRENFLTVFGDRHRFDAPFVQYWSDHGPYRLLFLDTQTAGTAGGAFGAYRLDWLDRRLSESPKPVLMFMHHHPTPTGAFAMDAKGVADWDAFHKILACHRGKIRHIFHGHCHTDMQGHVEGISFTGLRSMGSQVFPDLSTEMVSRWEGAPHYAVALVGDRSLVTHPQDFTYAGNVHTHARGQFADFARNCAQRGVNVPESDPEPVEIAS
ncbi:metallophosphoesterase [Pelagibacterium sp. H642]|uniref:metallophosphoesterase n=1 Tax=Pelagibacterium sp. H642 TaxID=1881069 RepID=UPI0028157C0A|nr:metallophosphoesterase [Pelagibacterium sp. H642]WMT92733.1 metallophosphoesterase [Pelagibacterium sp. H642]